ncbi:MAG: trypsin-like peptidase domain-containing protein [Thaumarchaeota archaeon]|nr:trypsin-like peptidase domain-containing protein [Nitrososphaerota archaeon]MCL5317297.1 trypsin-like peptidase domain-containing protein [Nitrososphaerota archaeon]
MNIAEFEDQITGVVSKIEENVVSIGSVKLARDYRFRVVPLEGQASGVIIDPRGYIVTNNHVVEEADRVHVTLKDGRTFIGEVVGTDPATDLALIKVDAEDLPAAKLGDSEKLRVGQIVLAIGNALGLPGAPTVSMGVISARGRPLPGTDFVLEGLIQTDAAINPGNSGGPLVDINGNVIGINTAMIPLAQGIGFAIPASTVTEVIEQIRRHGRVIRPWLGISGVDINRAVARKYELPTETGVLILEVGVDSPAYETGLKQGDILVETQGREIKQMKDLLRMLSKANIGDILRLTILRNGRRYETSVRLVESAYPTIRRRGR